MGQRALVAYERPDETYNLHYAHRGASTLRLKHAITRSTPFGGADVEAQWPREVFRALTTGEGVTAVREQYHLGSDTETDVNPLPRATGLTFEQVITEHLDYLSHEALYVVTPAFEVTAYRTHWFGLEYDADSISDCPTVGHGALRSVRWHDGRPVNDGYHRGEFRALKAVVGDLLDCDLLSYEEAIDYMQAKLRAWAGGRTELIIQMRG